MLLVLLLAAFSTRAQKLPNVQQGSLRAPADIKIDGKTTEWGDKFQAHNNATTLYYTISNDDENFYFTAQAHDENYVVKCIRQGITLTIGTAKESMVQVSYPESHAVRLAMTDDIFKKLDAKGAAAKAVQRDSLIAAMNKYLTEKLNQIKVTSVKAMPDSIIAVANSTGIQSAAGFDANRFYTYELAIPLKYLNLKAGDTIPLNYNVKMLGQVNPNNIVFTVESDFMKALNYTTDFSGKYTLAKKP